MRWARQHPGVGWPAESPPRPRAAVRLDGGERYLWGNPVKRTDEAAHIAAGWAVTLRRQADGGGGDTSGASWLVATDADNQGALGMRLAQAVPGEWYEQRLGRWPAYAKRCDSGRRPAEAAQLAQALALYLCRDYWPRVLTEAAAALACAPAEDWRDRSAVLAGSARLTEAIYAYVIRHSRIVIPGLVHVWLPVAPGGICERQLWAEWCEGPATEAAVDREEATERTLAGALDGRRGRTGGFPATGWSAP